MVIKLHYWKIDDFIEEAISMKGVKKLTINEIVDLPYFEFAARINICGHIGGLIASKQLLKYIKMTDGLRILDAGCGIGNTIFYIGKHYECEIMGIDSNLFCIGEAEKIANKTKMKSNVIFKAADISTLPFENDSFDRVIVENVFEFIEDKNRGLSEIIRVTKPGGYIGINSSFRHKKQTSEEKMMLDEMSKEIYKVGNFPFVLKEWEKLIKNYDLEDIQFLKPKITILSKLLDVRGNFLKFKNTLIISYFSLLNKKFRKKIFILKNNFKAIKKDPSLGFQFFIFKKPLK